MPLLHTSINPYQYQNELGKLKKIYTTTISSGTFVIMIYIFLIFLFALVKTIMLFHTIIIDLFIWFAITVVTTLILVYIITTPRFEYIATFEHGLVIKKRFGLKKLMRKEIKEVELRNLSLIKNFFRSNYSKYQAIDLVICHNRIISIGESKRIFRFISYPRIPTSTRILEINDLYDDLKSTVQ
jgi:hypothetical protein